MSESIAEQIRAAADARHLTALVEEIRKAAGELTVTALPVHPTWSQYRLFADIGERMTYEPVFFMRRRALNALAAAAMMDREPAVLKALADMLWSVCDEYTWAVPAHSYLIDTPDRDMTRCVDLFASETAHTLAEIVTGLADLLPQPVTDRVRQEVERRVLEPYFDDPHPWIWESARNNWVAVCAGAAGMAALALRQGLKLDRALERCRAAMDEYLSAVDEDGGCVEGVNYWIYGYGYFTYFAEALRDRTGEDLLDQPLARDAAAFPAAVQLGPERFPAFADGAAHQLIPAGVLCRLEARLGVAVPNGSRIQNLDFDHCYRWGHLSRTLAWTRPEILRRPAKRIGGAWLERAQWMIDRRDVDGLAVAFAAKGGHNDESHNHNDLGTFVLEAEGEELLADLGAGEYTAEYFGPRRYELLHPSSEGHSVPVIDGHGQRAGRGAAARVLRAERHLYGADLELDLSAAYDGETGLTRTFTWQAHGTLQLTDQFFGTRSVQEIFVSRLRPNIGDGTVAWHGSHAAALLTFDQAMWHPEHEQLVVPRHLGEPEVVHRLRLTARSELDAATFEFTIHPALAQARSGAPG
ncbi:heparinase II/III family protein [Streptacidiphilus sp. MAP5-3]|uniref:heparinase II/III domain-containing protein n=1 Tax=unclassified Streptacidiphilus TaxID=2643834 RepID=UPI003517D93B